MLPSPAVPSLLPPLFMLAPHARIAVIAPSGVYDPVRMEPGLELLRAWGYRPELLPGAPSSWRYLAGEDEVRATDLESALCGDWDAVWMARGGYGLSRLLPGVPWAALRGVPFFGFSDGTALLNCLAARGQPAVHAPVLNSLADLTDDASKQALRAVLLGQGAALDGETWVEGSAEGILRGGNLCVLASLCGTPYQLDAEGAIVLLEDVAEPPYRVDRLLTQLLQSGALTGAVGFAIGEFVGCAPPPHADWSLRDVLMERLGGLGVPIVGGLPVGHGARNHALPFGAARLGDGGLRAG